MSNVNNVIFFPGQRYFVLPIILISNYYEEKGENVKVVCSSNEKKMFQEYGYENTIVNMNESICSGERNLVFFQHNTSGALNFFLRTLESVSNKQLVKVSLMPDGLGNSMYGECFLEIATRKFDCLFELRDVFSFGFVHSTVAKNFESKKIVCLSLKTLHANFKKVMQSQGFTKLKSELANVESIILLPYRPWCTKSFHGGVYDFGDASDLARIYSETLRSLVKKYELDNSLVLFRGDERYPNESMQVFEQLEFDNKINLSLYLSEKITLEPLLHFLTNDINSVLSVVSLDSTTFQSIPLIKDDTIDKKIIGFLGCPRDLLEYSVESRAFFETKLKGKINDFFHRFKDIGKDVNNMNVEMKKEGQVYVEIN